jgi:hypothetical protein
MKTIIFVFAGRKENMELQLPHIRRILATHSDVEYHVWDLALEEADHRWLQTIEGERIKVIGDFYKLPPHQSFNAVYLRYTHPSFRACKFVKLDEDIIFLEDDRFGDFIDAITPNQIVSANVINNGACTRLEPGLWEQFEALISKPQPYIGVLRAPHLTLSEVHQSREYALMAHKYFIDHWQELVGQPIELVPATDWLSINVIGYDWRMGKLIHAALGKKPPRNAYSELQNVPAQIKPDGTLGDEGVCNLHPIVIMRGFIAAHLYFGPQRGQMKTIQVADLQNRYRAVGEQYHVSKRVALT